MCHWLPGGQGRWHRKRPSNPCTSCGAALLLGGTGEKAGAPVSLQGPAWAGTIHVLLLTSCLGSFADPRFEAVSCTVPGTRYNEGHWFSGQGLPTRAGLTGFSGRVEDSSVELAPMSNSKRMEEPIILPRKGDTRIALPGQVLYIRPRSTICVFYTCRRLSWPCASLSLGARPTAGAGPYFTYGSLRMPAGACGGHGRRLACGRAEVAGAWRLAGLQRVGVPAVPTPKEGDHSQLRNGAGQDWGAGGRVGALRRVPPSQAFLVTLRHLFGSRWPVYLLPQEAQP